MAITCKGPSGMTRKRRRGDGSLYRRADGIWVGAVCISNADGKRRVTVSSKKYDEAAKRLRKLRQAVEDGTFAASGNTTVKQWCEHWLDTIVRPRVRPKTFRYYDEAVRLHIIPTLGKKRLSKLTQEDVRAMHRAIQATGSTRNAVKAHQALQKALTDAVRDGLLARNVAELVDKPKHRAASRGALTARAARHVINTAVDRDDPLASHWAAALYTGARPGELLGLMWDYVDLDNGVLELAWQLQQLSKVHGCPESAPCGKARPGWCPQARWDLPPAFEYRECHRSLVLTRPKSKAGTRVVPIAGPLLALLRAHRAATAGQPNPHNLVWHDGAGRPIHPRERHRAWEDAAEAAGLAKQKAIPNPPRGVRAKRGRQWEVRPPAPYVSRHTAATLLMEAGVPQEVRMQIMGHSSMEAHVGYIHVGQGPKRAAIAALEGLLIDNDQG